MKVCVLGGRGFVGSAVTAELRSRGNDVVTMDPRVGGESHRSISILDENLQDHLQGVDVVVNLVGLSPMKRPGTPGYNDLHVAGAENVVGACEANGIDRLVHMSALGADPDADTAFLRTKGIGEEVVLAADVDVTVFRPSMIFDHRNELVEYAKLFAPLRLFPRIPTQIQPIYRGDVAHLFADAVDGSIAEPVVEIGGPEEMSLFAFVRKIYRVLGYPCYGVPGLPLMKLGLHIMEYVPFAPWGRDQARYLAFDNTTDTNQAEQYHQLTALDDWLDEAF